MINCFRAISELKNASGTCLLADSYSLIVCPWSAIRTRYSPVHRCSENQKGLMQVKNDPVKENKEDILKENQQKRHQPVRWVFASDFDDTLFFHDGRGLQESDVQAIREFQKRGNLFGLCTGRPAVLRSQIEQLTQGRIQFDFEIYSCGSVILDSNQEKIFEKTLPESFVAKASAYFPDVPFKAHSAKGILYSGPIERIDPGSAAESREDFLKDPVYEISFPKTNPAACRAVENLKQESDASCHENSYIADFVHCQVSKATGLGFVCKLNDVPISNSAAMGDSFNDLSMIEAAGIGFTFPDAEECVKEAADRQTGSIAQALAELMNQTE